MPYVLFNKKIARNLKRFEIKSAARFTFFRINEQDREYEIWKQESLRIEIDSQKSRTENRLYKLKSIT